MDEIEVEADTNDLGNTSFSYELSTVTASEEQPAQKQVHAWRLGIATVS